jgi:acyl-CoA synthetase (NDP forming)
LPDIGKLLWPRSVAVVGASSDVSGLRGRILQIMKGHPFAGAIYPVSRSAKEVQGLKAYAAVGDLPAPADLAVLIIPAKFVPEELERCGKAGIKAATILSSGFAEERGGGGAALQEEVRAIASRYDMAVSGPNGEGFANTAASLCPTFSPVMEARETPLMPANADGQVAVISQSGGMGFAFFDHGQPKNLSFRYLVTTGNEACLETFDFVDYMLDEGKTDVFLLLIEDIKTPATFERVAAKALRAGKPLIVCKLGQSAAGIRAVASHTAARSQPPSVYRSLFERHGIIESNTPHEMVDIAAAFLAFRTRLPAGRRVGICTSSGGGGAWLADACVTAGLDVPELDAATRALIDVYLPPYGTSQNPVDLTAQAVHQSGYAKFAGLVANSPAVDAVIMVITGRYPKLLEGDREPLKTLARQINKPVFMWTYTQPVDACVSLLRETGYPLFTDMRSCARTLCALADYRAARERVMRQ